MVENTMKETEKVNEEVTQAPWEKNSSTMYKYKIPPVKIYISKY